MISISVISTGQMEYVTRLLTSLASLKPAQSIEIFLTENTKEEFGFDLDQFDFNIVRIVNETPHGFARNHNQAFEHINGEYFLIINPDVVFLDDIFPLLVEDIELDRGQIVAPIVISPEGLIEDSFRRVPSPIEIISRQITPGKRRHFPITGEFVEPDWIAGMFLFMKSETFASLNGFDAGYYMYFEDVDFGSRARLAGLRLVVDTRCKIEHGAQRTSHSSLRYLRIHIQSAWRFFTSDVYREIRRLNMKTGPN
jgi:GT2 family glycosyltransferase